MKTTTKRILSSIAAMLLVTSVAHPGAGAITEELAVVQAMATLFNKEAPRPFDFLYFESEFSTKKNVVASLTDPDRAQFCGLTRDEALALVRELAYLNTEPVEFDKSLAKEAGLNIGHKQFPRYRYLRMSRVAFAPDNQRAWVVVDSNGENGAIYLVEKVGGSWNRAARCGGWVKAD